MAITLDEARQGHHQPRPLTPVTAGFTDLASFEFAQRAARVLASSTLVPEAYRLTLTDKKTKQEVANPQGLANCIVALNMAARLNADPLMVMQHLYLVEGRPSWSSQFIIAAINAGQRFHPLNFELSAEDPEEEVEYSYYEWEDRQRYKRTGKVKIRDRRCIAWTTDKATGTRCESPVISIKMAVAEGWYARAGSKWQTLPELMLRYRAAAFFGRLYAPELLMGLKTLEEVHDTFDAVQDQPGGDYAVAPAEPVRATPEPAPEPALGPDEPVAKPALSPSTELRAEGATPKAAAKPVPRHGEGAAKPTPAAPPAQTGEDFFGEIE